MLCLCSGNRFPVYCLLLLQWPRFRYENSVSFAFNITLDPDSFLEFGLHTRYIKVPVNIIHKEESKSSPGTYETKYTEMKTLELEIDIEGALHHIVWYHHLHVYRMLLIDVLLHLDETQ